MLSFKLIKLTAPQQFLSFFKEQQNSESPSMRLLVLHRFVSVGGVVGLDSAVGKLAYECVEGLLKDMSKMD